MKTERKGMVLRTVHLLSKPHDLSSEERKNATQLESPAFSLEEAEVCISMK
jgi:hypothetical protein